VKSLCKSFEISMPYQTGPRALGFIHFWRRGNSFFKKLHWLLSYHEYLFKSCLKIIQYDEILLQVVLLAIFPCFFWLKLFFIDYFINFSRVKLYNIIFMTTNKKAESKDNKAEPSVNAISSWSKSRNATWQQQQKFNWRKIRDFFLVL